MHSIQHFVECMLALSAVAIHPQDTRFRHQCRQGLLQPLRTMTGRVQISVAATGTGWRDFLLMAAMVTAQTALPQVHHQPCTAAHAGCYPVAGAAQKHRRIAAPVDEQQALLTARQPFAHGVHQNL